MNVDDFFTNRWNLPDAGRGTELHAGQVVTFEPPDVDHGMAILNLTKALSSQLTSADGYGCFELGLLTSRSPDTLLFPAISWFQEGPAFAESDKVYSESRPALVVEVASSPDRRTRMAERVQTWLAFGIRHIWVIDPRQRTVGTVGDGQDFEHLAEHQLLRPQGLFQKFELPVSQIFKEPDWWLGRAPRRV